MQQHLYGRAQDFLLYPRPEDIARPIEGKVVAKGMSDELYDRPFVLVASADGKAHWIKCERPEQVQALRAGDIVSVSQERSGWGLPLDAAQEPPRAVAIRRLSPLPLSAQESYPGPSWLDQKRSFEGRAPFGFGAELAAALKKREAYLLSLGLDPRDPAKSDRLLERERATLIKAEAERSGYRALLERGPLARAMHGVLREKTLPSGQRVALIFDERAREVAVVPWRGEWSVLLSQRVTLSRGEGHHLRLSPSPRGRDRGLSR
jgi:hypothetical protein